MTSISAVVADLGSGRTKVVGEGRQISRLRCGQVGERRSGLAWGGRVSERRPGENGDRDVEGVVAKRPPVAVARVEGSGLALFTDGETWAGQHASQALAAYRRKYNPDARVVLGSMVPVGHSIAEPGDPGVLNITGMDAALPMVVTEFIR